MAQIGTVRLETQNSGVVDVPVFEPGDSASGIYEFVRVETASGPGFIPVTDPVDATYPYLRVQSQNNGIVAVTDTPGSDIPDSEVYLHEDWGDNKYETRSGAGTTTYNGVQGVYRPEWVVKTGSASVSNDELTFNTDPTVLSTDINLDLSQTLRWFWRIDTGGTGILSAGLFAETNNESTSGGFPGLFDGYHIMSRENQPDTIIVREDTGGNTQTVARDTSQAISNGYIGAERSNDGDWTLYGTENALSDPKIDLFSGTYQLATGSDSTYTTANYISIGQIETTGGKIIEGKSF